MKKFYSLIFISYFILSSLVNAEVVKSVQINGNKRVSEETIKVYGEIEINKNYIENDLDDVIKKLYSTEFFEDVNVKISNNVLIINLKEYPIINQLIISGEKSNRIKDALLKSMSLKEKSSFIRSKLSKDIEIIKKIYSSVGYNFSKIETKFKKIDENNIDLIILVDRGNQTKISSIKFIGDKKIKDRRLRDIIASEEDKFWKVFSNNSKFNENIINLDKNLLRNYYKSMGYYNVEVVSSFAEISEDGEVEITYSIDAGKRFVVSKISTDIDPSIDKKIFSDLSKSYKELLGDFYSPFKVRKLLDRVGELVSNKDLQFIEYKVGEKIGDDTIELTIKIFEGERILVERINITGNNITNENVIRAELLLDEGDPFTTLNLNKSISKLKAKRIFRTVKSEVLDGSKNNLKLINIDVEEMPTGELSAGAGIGTDGGSFEASVSENNWLGEGKKLNFNISVDAESLSGVINYTNPNYNFMGNSLNYFVSSTENDKPDQGYKNTLLTAGINTRFEQFKDIYTNLGFSVSHDDLTTLDSASANLKKQSGSFSELLASYGFTKDSRNRAFMPSSGSIISFDQSFPVVADKQAISNTFKATKYKSLTNDVVGAGKIYLTAVNGIGDDDVRLSKRKGLSTRRLRGFERNKVGPIDGSDHIGGNYAAAVNFEASLPNLLPEAYKTDVGFFLDFGNVWGVDYDSSIDESNKIRSSTGVAASWLSPIGPLSFVFSTNLSKADTDKTESFNFNLGTTF